MNTQQVAQSLEETVERASVWLLQLTDDAVRHKPTPERWSIAEVVGHLVDSACNNHQRFIRAQEVEELTFPRYEQNAWVARGGYHDADWRQLVQLWRTYNLHLARVMRRIPVERLSTPCTIVPYDTCTLEFLVTDYLEHLRQHLTKIQERIVE